MDRILKDFNYSQQKEDIFSFWDDELLLRKKLRTAADSKNVKLQSAEDYFFMKRAFYFTDKSLFFSILFNNLHNMFLIDVLIQSPAGLVKEFLQFLPAYIQKNSPDNQKLKFIIHLYQDDWQDCFIEICNQLDEKKCRFLMDRTVNQGLLIILQRRLDSIKEAPGHGEPKSGSSDSNPFIGLYGDKNQLSKQCISLLTRAKSNPSDDKYIELSELLFKIGLLEDCLLIIKYKSSKTESIEAGEQKQLNMFAHHSSRLLHKTLPLYALLYHPADSYSYALDMYEGFFPEFNPDPASLLYLDLYQTAAAHQGSLKNYSFFELVTRIRKINSLRPGDELVFLLEQFINLKNTDTLIRMYEIARQRIQSIPHEGFIIMEIIRFFLTDINLVIPDKWADRILSSYLQLYYWIPSSLFMNQAIANRLIHRVDKKNQGEIERIIKWQNHSALQQLRSSYVFDSTLDELSKKESIGDFLFGIFLGVL